MPSTRVFGKCLVLCVSSLCSQSVINVKIQKIRSLYTYKLYTFQLFNVVVLVQFMNKSEKPHGRHSVPGVPPQFPHSERSAYSSRYSAHHLIYSNHPNSSVTTYHTIFTTYSTSYSVSSNAIHQ